MLTISSIDSARPLDIVSSHLRNDAQALSYVCVGDEIDAGGDENLVRGHGTRAVGPRLVACKTGAVHRQNKVVTVEPLKKRYVASVGDVVVGRVTEIAGKKWRIDLGGQGDTVLLLSAVTLPGGEQRRRTVSDELSMRSLFTEGDLVSAEVQKVHHDGQIMLHTRSTKYGRLYGGFLLTVPSALVKRQKQHFKTIETAQVDVIMGRNGFVWVSPSKSSSEEMLEDEGRGHDDGEEKSGTRSVERLRHERGRTARVGQSIRALARVSFMICAESIARTYELSLERGSSVKDMLQGPFLSLLVEDEALRRGGDEAMEESPYRRQY